MGRFLSFRLNRPFVSGQTRPEKRQFSTAQSRIGQCKTPRAGEALGVFAFVFPQEKRKLEFLFDLGRNRLIAQLARALIVEESSPPVRRLLPPGRPEPPTFGGSS